jgi:asparagine synthase (glutamine-hydrolysing)
LHFLKTSQVTLHDRSIWHGVTLAPPGTQTTLTVESANQVTWAAPLTFGEPDFVTSDKSQRLTHLLSEAVYRQSQADTPVGIYLSGGVDSSILAALLANMRRETIHTFAIALEGDTEDLEYARLVAQHIHSDHKEVLVDSDEFFARMRELTQLRALPVSLPNEVLIYRLSLEAKSKVKAVLSGEGADEFFGGYHRLQSRLRNSNGSLQEVLTAYRDSTTWFKDSDLRSALRTEDGLDDANKIDNAGLANLLDGCER